MISSFRPFLAMLLIALLPGWASAQTLPDETPPEVPSIDPPLPPGVLPDFPTVLISPISSGEVKMYVFYTPQAGTTGTFETSPDLENWTPTGTPAPQTGGLQVYTQTLDTSSEFYVRWRVQS